MKRSGCDTCGLKRLCEGSVTNRDTCSRKSKGCPPGFVAELPGSFCKWSREGIRAIKSGSNICFSVPGHWADKQIYRNAIWSSIYCIVVILYWCAVRFLVCFVHAWRGTCGFWHAQSTICCQFKRSMDIKSHFRKTRIPVEPTLTIIYFARFDKCLPYNGLPIELWTRNVLKNTVVWIIESQYTRWFQSHLFCISSLEVT